MSLENSLNEANKQLFEKLKAAGADISFITDQKATSWFMQENRSYLIGAPNTVDNYPAMAHELLHIELDLKGFWPTRYVYKFFHETNSSFNIQFINSLCNDLAHFKMLDDYLKMGFSVDDFLQQTPKQYFLGGVFLNTTILVAKNKAGLMNQCDDLLEIIRLVGGAKLFELYKLKDPNTVNGVHPDLVLNPLREINNDLIDALEGLFTKWNAENTVDNLQFFIRLNIILQEKGFPTYENCK